MKSAIIGYDIFRGEHPEMKPIPKRLPKPKILLGRAKAPAQEKAWRAKNPAKCKATRDAWRDANKNRLNTYAKIYHKDNAEKIKAYRKAYYAAHKI